MGVSVGAVGVMHLLALCHGTTVAQWRKKGYQLRVAGLGEGGCWYQRSCCGSMPIMALCTARLAVLWPWAWGVAQQGQQHGQADEGISCCVQAPDYIPECQCVCSMGGTRHGMGCVLGAWCGSGAGVILRSHQSSKITTSSTYYYYYYTYYYESAMCVSCRCSRSMKRSSSCWRRHRRKPSRSHGGASQCPKSWTATKTAARYGIALRNPHELSW